MKRLRRTLKRYFIPHEENNHKPQMLRSRTLFFACFAIILVEVAFIVGPLYLINRSRLFGIIVVNALVDETNQNRIANNLPPLQINPLLQAAAQDKANDMATNGYFAHTSPAGLSPWYWFGKVGYDYAAAGENLAVNFSDSQDVMNAWMNSPEHRANILDANFTQIGMATAQGTYDGAPATYVVEEFGEPAAAVVLAASASAAAAVSVTASAPARAKPSGGGATTTEPVSVAVKGAATQAANQPAPSAPVVPVVASTPRANILQNNPIQDAVAAPRSIANDFYLFVIGLFALALVLNIFIQIRIQYPSLIFGGVVVIALAAMFIVLNQQGALTGLRIG